MQSVLRAILRGALRAFFRGVIGRPGPEAFHRFWMRLVTGTTLRAGGTRSEPVTQPVPGVWERPAAGSTDRAILYLHGGGYTLGSHATHTAITSHLAKTTGASVLVPDYRLAPEHPYPAALDDAVSAYRFLLERYTPGSIAVGGDSAGGGLALLLVLALRERGIPMPSSLLLLSPWTDLTLSGETIGRLADADPLLSQGWLLRASAAFRGPVPADDPRVSPLFADLHGLPRTLIQVGADEILLSDSQRFAERARAAGVEVDLQCEPGLWHDFQIHAGVLKAADAAIARIAAFIDQGWRATDARPQMAAA